MVRHPPLGLPLQCYTVHYVMKYTVTCIFCIAHGGMMVEHMLLGYSDSVILYVIICNSCVPRVM